MLKEIDLNLTDHGGSRYWLDLGFIVSVLGWIILGFTHRDNPGKTKNGGSNRGCIRVLS